MASKFEKILHEELARNTIQIGVIGTDRRILAAHEADCNARVRERERVLISKYRIAIQKSMEGDVLNWAALNQMAPELAKLTGGMPLL